MWYQWSFLTIIDAFQMKHPDTHKYIFNLFPPLRLKLMQMCLPAAPPCTATSTAKMQALPKIYPALTLPDMAVVFSVATAGGSHQIQYC